MSEVRLKIAQAFAALPPAWGEDLYPRIRQLLAEVKRKVIVLDDDPTGTQAVHDVPLVTRWDVPTLRSAVSFEAPAAFVLTNSRSLPETQATALARTIGGNLREAAHLAGQDVAIISRSDSTLRGHYPAETDALAQGLGAAFDATFLIPFFDGGGRYTIGDVHYVAEGDELVPAGQTPFARDAAFGYRSSNLRRWVEEKTAGRVPAGQVASISLEDLRCGGPERVAALLENLKPSAVCIVNAVEWRDLEVLCVALLEQELAGRRYLYRTAAPFAAVRSGIAPRALLACDELGMADRGAAGHAACAGGLIIVGSHVPRSSGQLAHLLASGLATAVEVNVERVLDDETRGAEIQRAASAARSALRRGEDVVTYTSRRLVTGSDAAGSLLIGQRISSALVDVVNRLEATPRYLLVKGGITANDIATEACGVRLAMVRGQVLPGVPVWRLGPETRYPGMDYIVFPGNVGGEDAITRLVSGLKRR